MVMGEVKPEAAVAAAEQKAKEDAAKKSSSFGTSVSATDMDETAQPRDNKVAKIRRGRTLKEPVAPPPETVSLAAAAIGKYWLTRMRFIRSLRLQVQGFAEQQLQKQCKYCGTDVFLDVELLQSMEDLFREFLVATGEPMPGHNFQRWVSYFKKHARFRTLCFDCAAMIEEYHRKR
jgi:hypothetical protein